VAMQIHMKSTRTIRAGEEEKIFISSVPLIPDRICSTRNLKAPDGIPNIIYTGRCGAGGALHRRNRTSIVGVGTIGR
jgi:hypothetical protein